MKSRPSSPRFTRGATLSTLLLALTFVVAHEGVAHATLQLVKPNPSVNATFVGKGGYSADGLGQDGTGGTVQAEVPVGSTVTRAYLYATYFENSTPSAADRTFDFDGTTVVMDFLANSEPGPCCSLATARAEVTGQVASKVGGGGGITDFAVNTDPATVDGVALVVIFSNPALPDGTIAVLDGGSKQTGDSTVFNFSAPLDKTVPNFAAQMSLGSGFSFQDSVGGHSCGGDQFSTVAVNTQPLANCAGNYDDGLGEDGALITVGGVGDSIDNPTPPPPADPVEDDELYNLSPFLSQGDNALVIDTTNPSGDDNLFLAVISFTARVAGTVELCNNGIDEDGDGLIDGADPDCPPDPYAETCFGNTIDGSNVQGGEANDKLNGTPRTDQLRGGGGKDKIKGKDAADCLFGQAGGDKLGGDDGGDILRGGSGNDKLSGNKGNDTIRAQDGDDRVKGDAGDDTIKAQGRGRDKVNCGSGKDRVVGDIKDTISKNCENVKIVDPK